MKRTWPTARALLLLPAVLAAPGAQAEGEKPTGWALQGLPIVGYNSDEGFGLGVKLLLLDRADGTYEPYRYSIWLQLFQTTGGISSHVLDFDAPNAFGTEWRLGGRLRYGFDKFAPYYGLGNTTEYQPELSDCDDRVALQANPDLCPGNPEFRGLRYYTYQLGTFPEIELNVRRALFGPWKIFAGYRFRLNELRAHYTGEDLGQTGDSRLIEDARGGLLTGLDGSVVDPVSVRLSEVVLAVQFDLRDQETSATDGMFHELAARVGSRFIGSQYDYWGVTVHLRYYRSIPFMERPPVLAFRLLGDVLGGEVPVFRLPTFGGLNGKDGLGGSTSIRGILKNRIQGAVKLLGNAELRWIPFAFEVWKQRFELGGVAFFDTGRVWSDLRFLDGGGLSSGVGGGLRVVWNREFVVRVDYGVGLSDPTRGFYIEFHQMF
jgi:outer membrane protein assembly factor BamA